MLLSFLIFTLSHNFLIPNVTLHGTLDVPTAIFPTIHRCLLLMCTKAHMCNRNMHILHIHFHHFHHRSLQHYAPVPFFSPQSNLPEPKTNQRHQVDTWIISRLEATYSDFQKVHSNQ